MKEKFQPKEGLQYAIFESDYWNTSLATYLNKIQLDTFKGETLMALNLEPEYS